MKSSELNKVLDCAVRAARAAGGLMRTHLHRAKTVNSAVQHDIKLELDVRSQKLIERTLLAAFPGTAVLGEEGVRGDKSARHRWVVDPIDGTVNFTYGIPHACVSIAFQERQTKPLHPLRRSIKAEDDDAFYKTLVGVVLDPFCDELWTAVAGGRARLNGRPVRASRRSRLDEAIVSLGFAKSKASLNRMLPAFTRLVPRVRKIRIMGAAALAMTYVASGRFDAYAESGIRLWDIAAGGLILECSGGEFWREQIAGEHTYAVIANNGSLRCSLQKYL